jgi:hypothetical protein
MHLIPTRYQLQVEVGQLVGAGTCSTKVPLGQTRKPENSLLAEVQTASNLHS